MTEAADASSQAAPAADAQPSGGPGRAAGAAGATTGESRQDADRFSMAIPSGWMILPMDPATRDRRIAGLVRHRMGKEDRYAYLRRQYILKLRKVVAEAASNGAFFGAVHSGAIKGVPMMASVLVSMLPQVSDAAGNVLTHPEALAADVAAGRGEASQGETLEQGVAELQVGMAARIRRRAPLGIVSDDGREVIGETIHYYVPLPEARRTLAMVFSTPMLSVAEAYTRLFDVMALSANWKRSAPGPPAVVQAPGPEEQDGHAEQPARPRHARAAAGGSGPEEEVEPDAEDARPKHAKPVPEEASR